MPTFGHLTVHSSPATCHACASRSRRNPIGTVHHRTGGSSVARTSWWLPCGESSEDLGASVGSANLHHAGLNINVCQDGVLGTHGFEEILQHARPPFNSLGELPTLCAQPYWIDDTEDCNYVRKVFLGVPTGLYGHVEVGIVWKHDLQGLRFFLGRDNIRLRYLRDGRPIAQLPFLALSILQPVGRLEGSTHFGVLPESSTKQEFLERRLQRNSYEPRRLNCGLKIRRMQKILGPWNKTLLVPIPYVQPIGWSGTKTSASCKMHCSTWARFWIQSVLSIKCSRRTKKLRVVFPL